MIWLFFTQQCFRVICQMDYKPIGELHYFIYFSNQSLELLRIDIILVYHNGIILTVIVMLVLHHYSTIPYQYCHRLYPYHILPSCVTIYFLLLILYADVFPRHPKAQFCYFLIWVVSIYASPYNKRQNIIWR